MFIYFTRKTNIEELPILCFIRKWEGEIMELGKYEGNRICLLGDQITFYYIDQMFEGKIIKTVEDDIYVFVALDEYAKKTYQDYLKMNGYRNRRETPRISVQMNGSAEVSEQKLHHHSKEKRLVVEIQNVSINGIGFITQEYLHLNESYDIRNYVPELAIRAKVKIINRHMLGDKKMFYYGSKIEDIETDDFFLLRKFVLMNQIQSYIQDNKD